MPASSLIANRYQLLDKIGQGGMGAVYKAKDRLNNQIVALKRVNTDPSNLIFNSKTDEDMLLSLTREFRILASLRHPNIISVLDYGFDSEQHPFFTMQLLDKPQFFFEVAQSASLEEKVNLFIQVLQALSYLHQHGIVHRDLKPENLLVQDGQVYILDFGLSVVAEVASGRAGTVDYMSPEILRRAQATQQSDLFTVGVMMYRLIAGKFPYNMQALLGMIPFVVHADLLEEHPLELVILRLIAEKAEDRYESAQATIQALCDAIDIALPPENRLIRESFLQSATFVGREKELETLEEALQAANKGQGSVWLVGGESGVGKSRLMDEFRVQALIEGALVIQGQGIEEGGLPYQLWREPIRRLVLSIDLDDLSASVLKELAPGIGSLLERDVKDAPPLGGKAYQQRLVLAITDVFKKQTQLTVLILEDLQWAVESLEPLKQLCKIADEHRLLIIGNYRNDERPTLPDELIGSHLIHLPRLDEEKIIALSTAMLGETGRNEELIQLFQRETEGNLFFLVETIRALAEDAGSLNHIGQMTLPASVFTDGIRTILQRKLNKISDSLQAIQTLAAIIGREINIKLLTFHFPQDQVDDWLIEASNVAILDIQDNRWRFAHDKLREAVLLDLADEERISRHEEAAQALERYYKDEPAYWETLAQHWYEAKNFLACLGYISRMAERSRTSRGDHATAQILIERGNHLIAIVGEESASRLRLPLLLLQGEIALQKAHYEEAKTHIQKAADIAGNLGDEHTRIDALNLYAVSLWYRGLYAKSQVIAGDLLQKSKQIKYPKGQAWSLNSLAIIARHFDDAELAKVHYERSHDIFLSLNDSWGIAVTLGNLALLFEDQEDYERARVYCERGYSLAKDIGDLYGIAKNRANLASIAFKDKDYQLAQDCIYRSAEALQHTLAPLTIVDLLSSVVLPISVLLNRDKQSIRFARAMVELNTHPYDGSEPFAHLDEELQSLLAISAGRLSDEDYQDAIESGKLLDSKALIQELINQFEDSDEKNTL